MQANSGEEALELLTSAGPDVIIVDVRMGGMDGNAFIRKSIRKSKKKAVFFICTGSPEYEIPEDLRKYSRVAKKYLQKNRFRIYPPWKMRLRIFTVKTIPQD